MHSALVIRIEKSVDRTASVLFALACGFSANLWFAFELPRPVLAAATIAAAACAYFISARALGAVEPEPERIPVPIFDIREVGPMDPAEAWAGDRIDDLSELLLTDRLGPARAPSEEEFILDDILAEVGPNSRVVRLFDPAAMPNPGELRARIDQHRCAEASEAQTNDAAQALHDALAQLRRSLR